MQTPTHIHPVDKNEQWNVKRLFLAPGISTLICFHSSKQLVSVQDLREVTFRQENRKLEVQPVLQLKKTKQNTTHRKALILSADSKCLLKMKNKKVKINSHVMFSVLISNRKVTGLSQLQLHDCGTRFLRPLQILLWHSWVHNLLAMSVTDGFEFFLSFFFYIYILHVFNL